MRFALHGNVVRRHLEILLVDIDHMRAKVDMPRACVRGSDSMVHRAFAGPCVVHPVTDFVFIGPAAMGRTGRIADVHRDDVTGG